MKFYEFKLSKLFQCRNLTKLCSTSYNLIFDVNRQLPQTGFRQNCPKSRGSERLESIGYTVRRIRGCRNRNRPIRAIGTTEMLLQPPEVAEIGWRRGYLTNPVRKTESLPIQTVSQ